MANARIGSGEETDSVPIDGLMRLGGLIRFSTRSARSRAAAAFRGTLPSCPQAIELQGALVDSISRIQP